MSGPSGAIFIAGCAAAVLALFLAARQLLGRRVEGSREVASSFLGVAGTLYAVLLAFAFFVVWGQYDDVKTAVDREAAQVVDLARLARALPEAQGRAVLGEIEAYASLVVSDEWPAMARGDRSRRVDEAVHRLWAACETLDPSSNRETIVAGELLRRMADVGDARRLRLHASRDRVPWVVQAVLWFGALVTLVLMAFLQSERSRAPAVMAAALTAQIASILFLVLALDAPFTGPAALGPHPFEHAVEWVRALR